LQAPKQVVHIRLGFSILEVQRVEGGYIEVSPLELADGDPQIPPALIAGRAGPARHSQQGLMGHDLTLVAQGSTLSQRNEC
jgi:hypothetical protein